MALSAWIENVIEAWARWMLPMSWQVAILAVAIWLICLLARRATPRLRYALWCLVLLKLCLPPSLAFVTGIGRWLPARTLRQPEAYGRNVGREVDLIVQPGQREPAVPALSSAEAVVGSLAVTPQMSTRDRGQPGALSVSWPALAFGVWAAGVFVMAGLLTLACVRVRRQLSLGVQVEDARVLEAFCQARGALGIQREVELLAAEGLASPILFGLRRPRIALPTRTLHGMPVAELKPVFLHELIHLRRRDLWVNWLQAALQTVYWFHPLAWYVNLQLRRERELIVDDSVLAHLDGRSSTYSSSLLNVSRHASCARWLAPGYVGIVETGSSISRRICRILDRDRRLSLRLGWVSGLAVVLFALVMVPQGSPAPAEDARAEKKAGAAKADEKLTAVAGVVADGDGRPVAHARITAFSNVGLTPPFSLAIDTRTGAEGRFRVLLTRSLYFAEVTKDGLTSGTFELYAGLAEKGPVRVTLKKGGRIQGTVVRRADGRPVAGAMVWLYSRRGAQTDAQGRFELAPVERGEVGLAVIAAGLASRYVEVNLSGRDSCEVRVEMPSGFSVRGKVVDAKGRSVAGAGLSASGGRWRSTFGGSFAAITDNAGRYEIVGLPFRAQDASANERVPGSSAMSDSMGDRIWVSAWHPQHKSATAVVSPPATGDSTTVDLAMRGRGRFIVNGVVRDHRGQPVSGAKVTCPDSSDRRRASTLTDAAGLFRLGEVDDRVLVEAKGYALAWQRLPQPADGRVSVAFKLTRGRTVAGVVVGRTGRPIVGAVVSPTIAIDHSFDYEPEWRVTSDEKGLFRINDLPRRGRVHVDVRADGHVPVHSRRLRTWLPNTVVMDSQGVIVGQVLDERTGEPVTSLRVRLDESRGGGGIAELKASFPRDAREPGRDSRSTVGAFTIGGLTSGAPYAVIVNARGYAPARVNRVIARSPDWEGWPLVVKVGVGTCVLGQVLDAQSGVAIVDAEVVALAYSGRGPGEFDIALFGSSQPGLRKTRTDRDGQFVLPGLEAGTTALVAVRAPGYGLCIQRRVPFDEPVTIQLARAGRITGSAAGLPDVDLAGASVMLNSTDASFGRASLSARDGGKYCFDGLPAGDYTVRVIAHRFEPHGGGGRLMPELKATARVSLSAGETASVRFPNVPRFTIAGRVKHNAPAGRRVGVSVQSRQMDWSASARADADGRYVIRHVPVGEYWVEAEVEGGAEPVAAKARRAVSVLDRDVRMDFKLRIYFRPRAPQPH